MLHLSLHLLHYLQTLFTSGLNIIFLLIFNSKPQELLLVHCYYLFLFFPGDYCWERRGNVLILMNDTRYLDMVEYFHSCFAGLMIFLLSFDIKYFIVFPNFMKNYKWHMTPWNQASLDQPPSNIGQGRGAVVVREGGGGIETYCCKKQTCYQIQFKSRNNVSFVF